MYSNTPKTCKYSQLCVVRGCLVSAYHLECSQVLIGGQISLKALRHKLFEVGNRHWRYPAPDSSLVRVDFVVAEDEIFQLRV